MQDQYEDKGEPMIITAGQMATFKSSAKLNFAMRLTAYFESRFSGKLSHSGETISRGRVLEQEIIDLINAAEGFGISRELGVGQFVSIGLGYSRTFYQIDRVIKMLKDPVFTPEQNIQRVLNAVIVAENRGR